MTVPVTVINLALTTIILILGLWAFFKRRSDIARSKVTISGTPTPSRAVAIPGVSLYIGVAFGLFAISHALTLAGLAKSLEVFIISIRIIGYLLVIVAPSRILMKK